MLSHKTGIGSYHRLQEESSVSETVDLNTGEDGSRKPSETTTFEKMRETSRTLPVSASFFFSLFNL